MKPKIYFVLKVYVLLFLAFLVFIAAAFLVSFILFSIKASGELSLLGFGGRGFLRFFLVFPWLLLFINIALLILIDILLRRFKFAYNRPILYSFLLTLVAITAFATVLNKTSVHKSLLTRSENKHLPFIGGFYSGIRISHQTDGTFRGVVKEVYGRTFVFRQIDDGNGTSTVDLVVSFPSSPNIFSEFQVGDEVYIAGDLLKGQIEAFGVRKLDNN
jgi:hypothetical protein